MANADPSRTEAPTPKRIEDARRDGKVLMSEEVISLAVVIAGALLIVPTARLTVSGFGNLVHQCIRPPDLHATWSASTLTAGLAGGLLQLGLTMAPFLGGVCLAAIAATRLQTGHYVEINALKWKLDEMNPATGFKRVLPTWENLVKLLLVLAKLAVIGGLVYLVLRRDWERIAWLPTIGIEAGAAWIFGEVARLTATILGLLTAVAALDYLHKRKRYLDNLMMTKQEVKDEYRNLDGDPHIKARLRQRMRDLTLRRLIVEVPRADVIVTNPTHVAVALRYVAGEGAPRVIAKGLRKRALRIREIAQRHGVPIVEAPPVARALYRTTLTGTFIPSHLYTAVAAILARIYQRRSPGAHPSLAR